MTGTRPPAVAGLFYPSDPGALAAQVRAHLSARASPASTGGSAPMRDVRALIAPHAGYVYSGPTAGVAYRMLAPVSARVRRVLLLGPPHVVPVLGVAVSGAQRWSTPLGDVVVDDQARTALVAASHAQGVPWLVVQDDDPHVREHSLEVQLPFLQLTLPEVAVLPVLVGDGPVGAVAGLLDDWWAEDSLIVVSTDLSHYETQPSAQSHDARTSAAIVRADPDAIGDRDACGARALRVLLTMAARRGAVVTELDRRTSADTAGSPDRVVGYGAFAVHGSC
jgi:AmmeMemoRadiSam system protein B